ncbi:hypothetical protein [Microbulbifer variabilis]|uniref:hypothetical protein n=1 Tax=Microbulbifer variabilis TaxID=266805 RepID=UPI001CFF2B08|nr:hypothetical protein [Microbulbifer variabilis]
MEVDLSRLTQLHHTASWAHPDYLIVKFSGQLPIFGRPVPRLDTGRVPGKEVNFCEVIIGFYAPESKK